LYDADAAPQFDVIDVLLFFGLGSPLFVFVFLVVQAALKIAQVDGEGVRVLVSQFAGYLASLIPLYMIAKMKYDRSPLQLARMSIHHRDVANSLSLGILTSIVIVTLSVLLKTPQIKMPMEELLSGTASLVAAALLSVTLGPWFEELIFRGILQPLLGRYAGGLAGILISALMFAALHGPQYAWSWRHVLLIAVAGAAFGLRRMLTGSTGAAVVMHAAYNMVLFAAFLAAKFSGAPIPKTI